MLMTHPLRRLRLGERDAQMSTAGAARPIADTMKLSVWRPAAA